VKNTCIHCGQERYHLDGCIAFLAGVRRAREVQSAAPEEVDVCLAGNPAVDGKCGQPDCVCSSNLPFAQLHSNVMRGSDRVATAVSRTMAKRIARALNAHKPNSRGE
jgi:hypothetical protein